MSSKIKERATHRVTLVEDDRDVYTLGLERMEKVYNEYDNVIVMFSGGKDSTSCLHLALETAKKLNKLPVKVQFFDEEAIPLQVESYVRRVSQREDISLEWFCVPIKHRNACSNKQPYWYTWNPAEKDLWVRDIPEEGITADDVDWVSYDKASWDGIPGYSHRMYPYNKYGNAAIVLGIRADESLTRRRAVSNRLYDNWIIRQNENVVKAYPIYDWKTEDVWTAPAKYDWDYCEAYDLMEMAGVSAHNQRVAPPFGEQPMKRLWTYAVCFPEIWDKMTERVQGANTAGLYTKHFIEMYGESKSGGNEAITLPDGMSWKEFLIELLKKHEDRKIRMHAAGKIKKEITSHYKRTSDPILPRVHHPFTGLSYEYLAKIAIKGDMKNRMDASMNIDTKKTDDQWAKYNDCLEEYKTLKIDWEYSNE